jgi:hypothetical protein
MVPRTIGRGPRLPWPGWRCSDPDWQAASQALDDPMGKLLVIRRLLEADEHLPKRQPRAAPT